jgi:hypothetical protein
VDDHVISWSHVVRDVRQADLPAHFPEVHDSHRETFVIPHRDDAPGNPETHRLALLERC